MSEIYDIDESEWQDYVNDCRANGVRPQISDYLIWLDENDMERPETWEPYE
jgi:hypothetical protein